MVVEMNITKDSVSKAAAVSDKITFFPVMDLHESQKIECAFNTFPHKSSAN